MHAICLLLAAAVSNMPRLGNCGELLSVNIDGEVLNVLSRLKSRRLKGSETPMGNLIAFINDRQIPSTERQIINKYVHFNSHEKILSVHRSAINLHLT